MTSATAALPTPRGHDPAKASDQLLMARIAAGDTRAFDELYRRHHRAALLHARKLCAGRELAEEVMQEAFVSLWRGAHRYRPGLGSVSAWLASMVRNRAIDAWRRASVRPVDAVGFDDSRGAVQTASPGDARVPDRVAALSMLSGLPPAQKEVLFLSYFADMSQSEIAARAGAPLGTIKGRLRLGLEKLRSGLEEPPVRHSSRPGLAPGSARECLV
ncbi:MAG: hypothetical protein QOE11_3364 [Solirubrobacteraceae bacterium]|jgi:RNA polymerase sigma-70 factor (ECF subfamily)|nr:hypothetical protein [Solirubrobacteraceae bacterium]